MPLPGALARFNRVVTNRILGVLAPWLPPFAVVVHRGRRSGREYRTPVWAFHRGGRYVFVLTYGSRADWVRNLFAAGGCGLVRLGGRVALTRPRLIRAESGRGLVPFVVEFAIRAMGVREFLLLEPDDAAVGGGAMIAAS